MNLLLIFLGLISFSSFGQDFAMDFQQEDCEGNSHNLFSELNAGKVIILDYVMLNCAPCIVANNALENIKSDYDNSHPGRVSIYSFGFLNSYNCEQMVAWKNDNGYSHPVFNNGEDQVDYYGGMGMPTIVIVGTNGHNVFFKSIGYTSALDNKIREALDSALLYDPTAVNEIPLSEFSIYPTVATDYFIIESFSGKSDMQFSVFDTYGRELQSGVCPETGKVKVDVKSMPAGIYYARLNNGSRYSKGIKVIVR